ncbi:MAG: carboxypeptidase regulatory-like domain-containing protein [Candidatus Paceibacterota bacterium]
MHVCRHQTRGFSLVEVIVVSALVTLMFSGLFAGVRVMVELIGTSKAESGARSLAIAKLEYIRSLPYDSVGTTGGIPDGPLPQTATTTLNGITYTERILVQYLDRPEDGFGIDDENGVTEDSKTVKVEYSWVLRGSEESLALATDIIPNGIESTTGGGTLFINVFDANVQPVADANVRVFNDTGTSTIDVTVQTNANGIANFPGAPPLSGYQITATKAGYSTDQTYSSTPTNSSPNPPHVSVLTGTVSTVNFAIDALSSLLITAFTPPQTETYEDTFDDMSGVVNASDVTTSGGALVLSGSAGTYSASGEAYSLTSEPSLLDSWDTFDLVGSTTPNTAFTVHLYSVTGSGTSTSYTLIPDAVLPQNSTGFSDGPVDIEGVSTATYPRLALGATLTSSDPNETPSLDSWSITHVTERTPLSDVTFDIIGNKTIGEHGGSPVLKYENAVTTDGSGEVQLSGLEWDLYTITVDGAAEGYDIVEVEGLLPYTLEPGVADELVFTLDTHTAHSLHVSVVDADGSLISGAEVVLAGDGFSETATTGTYGQVFFGGLSADTYTVTVTTAGYGEYVENSVPISGQTQMTVELNLE